VATIGFDTATADLTVAVSRDGEPLLEREQGAGAEGRPRHSELLLAEIERCVEAAGGWSEVGRIAVGVGPGSYTGLRIGIATARALAQGRGLPIVGVCTLSALALGISELPEAEGRPVAAVLDARRGQAFVSLRGPAGEEIAGPAVLTPAQLAELASGIEPAPLVAGDGALRFRAELEAVGATVAPPGDAVHRVAARCICALSEGASAVPPEEIEPIYLREPDAKRWLQRDDGSAG
jgi:tRNA threonylcarbamoyladenosine biosynthesis protein TsaB